jgi:hypothetical protein
MIKRALWTGALALGVFVSSVLYHLPAAWLWPKVSVYLPTTIALSEVEGRVWQGAAQVRWQNVDVGRVAWQFDPWALLQAKAVLRLHWQGLTLTMAAERQSLALSVQDGQLDLAHLSTLPLAQFWGGMPVQGALHFRGVAWRWPYQQAWFSAWQGRVVVTDLALALFDIRADQLALTPVLAGEQWNIALQAEQAAAWQLSGDLAVFRDRRYTLALNLQADKPSSRPVWANAWLRADTPTQSHYRAQGRW